LPGTNTLAYSSVNYGQIFFIALAPDLDKSAVPDWLREELNNSEEAWIDDLGSNNNVNNGNNVNNNRIKSAEQRKKSEKEFNQVPMVLNLFAALIYKCS
jgi:hypothetical protein